VFMHQTSSQGILFRRVVHSMQPDRQAAYSFAQSIAPVTTIRAALAQHLCMQSSSAFAIKQCFPDLLEQGGHLNAVS
ncbi:MAG: hypothetical protein IKC86_01375, partial [Prevotella sp.]|nr:hypothetical protein [Prevotella sp.]